jgi:cyclic pyranopterin phosphate synthase
VTDADRERVTDADRERVTDADRERVTDADRERVTDADPLPELTHLDPAGRARMVDVGEKPATDRHATARAVVRVSPETARAVVAGDAPKGDVLGVARIAGIQAAKRTAELIPLCHPLALSHVGVEAEVDEQRAEIVITAEARTTGPTGVEMEALTAAAVAALTVYDMVKGIERGAQIAEVALLEKSGGRSGVWRRD